MNVERNASAQWRRTLRGLASIGVTIATVGALGVLTGSGVFFLGNRSAQAVVGRPVAPIAFVGVARRTSRRAAAAAVSSNAGRTSLSADCVTSEVEGAIYYHCGSGWYQPQYSGTTIVYVPVEQAQ